MRQYVIGVDGGGTKTHYALFDRAGNKIGFWQGGPANHEAYPEGYQGARQELSQSFQKLFQESGVPPEQIGFVFLGLAGIDVTQQKEMMSRVVREIGFTHFEIMNDAFLGIKAAAEHGYGVCSINGTGTCCAGIDPGGHSIQVGGTGYFFGDEGGSGHIGGMALRKVYDSVFRGGPATLMKELLFDMLRIRRDEDLMEEVYRQHYYNNWVEFAKIPFQAANQGDPVAIALLQNSGREAAKSVLGAIRRLDFGGVDPLDIILVGSVYVKGENPALIEAFQEKIRTALSQQPRFTILQIPPVAGAIIGALEVLQGGRLEPEIRARVRQHLSGA